MTGQQKQEIRYWRGEGLGYKAIASKVDVSESAVKSHCQRHNLRVFDGTACRHCDQPITQQPKQKPRKFCGTACRQAWWNIHGHLVDRHTDRTLACANCGQAFSSYGSRKFCCHPCYIAARFRKEVRHEHSTIQP
ncbi:MAG: sigma-70 region 4 domain-containing protein [Oscillospiraceae bacterium]|nr:sigma-70 region 4 domain-containing protein [Oscillospiraceae bacterium]